MNFKTAVILAAGQGTRLRNVTEGSFPKPLTPVDGLPLVEYSIQALIYSGIEKIWMGCGYMIESFSYLESKYKQVQVIENKKYDVHASIYTLLIFKDRVQEAFFLLESDLLYDPKILLDLQEKSMDKNIILTSRPLQLEDNVYYHSENGMLTKLGKQVDSEKSEGVMTGIWSLKKGFLPRFSDYCYQDKNNLSRDYETLLADYSAEEDPIQIMHRDRLNWCEIDNENHLEYAVKEVMPAIKKGSNFYSQ